MVFLFFVVIKCALSAAAAIFSCHHIWIQIAEHNNNCMRIQFKRKLWFAKNLK